MPASAAPPAGDLPADPFTLDPFTLGVASGDPRSDRVIIWTRLAPTPLSEGDRLEIVQFVGGG